MHTPPLSLGHTPLLALRRRRRQWQRGTARRSLVGVVGGAARVSHQVLHIEAIALHQGLSASLVVCNVGASLSQSHGRGLAYLMTVSPPWHQASRRPITEVDITGACVAVIIIDNDLGIVCPILLGRVARSNPGLIRGSIHELLHQINNSFVLVVNQVSTAAALLLRLLPAHTSVFTSCFLEESRVHCVPVAAVLVAVVAVLMAVCASASA